MVYNGNFKEKESMTEKTHITSMALAVAITLPLATGLSGCALTRKTAESFQNYWVEETGIAPGKMKRKNLDMTSSNPDDYILPDGTGIAIPAKAAYDYYISPFAPTQGYILSKAPEGSRVICPYSGHILILGERKHVAEKEIY